MPDKVHAECKLDDGAHLNEHSDACYSLEGQEQERHEGQSLALMRLLETSDDCIELRVVLPVTRNVMIRCKLT